MNNSEINIADIERIVSVHGRNKKDLIPILLAIQDLYHYLPEPALDYVSAKTNSTPSDIMGVSTFYSQFRMKPAGRHNIKICIGTACHVKGASQVHDDFKKYLNIAETEDTDADRLFTVTKAACLGCCMLAPAVQIDDITYGHVTKSAVPHILTDFLSSLRVSMQDTGGLHGAERVSGTVKMCICSSCSASGAGQVYANLQSVITRDRFPVKLKIVGCTGISYEAPLIEIEANKAQIFRYGLVKPHDAEKILYDHFKPTILLPRIRKKMFSLLEGIYTNEDVKPIIRHMRNIRDKHPDHFVSCQQQIATRHSGQADPLDVEEYMHHQGFEALNTCIRENDPDRIIKTIEHSRLRGRGGAGFQTSIKWRTVRDAAGEKKYIICNGDEGDPGAFMNRMLMESFPFRVLEGMAIAALACGIRNGYIFLRSEYPLAIERMKRALEICRERKLLGGLELKLIISAGAFVCGEETALISSVEGDRGNPSLRPPYPSHAGLWGKPTLVNNVETCALVPWIILNGNKAFSAIGTHKSSGTKTFALAGKINKGGLIEIAMGTTLKDIIYTIGGGIQDNKKLKAVQIGGPAGGCVPATHIEAHVDYEGLKELGTIMGSGGMIVLDEDDCIVDVAQYFMNFTQLESCGKCTFCRIGTRRMLEMLQKITGGEGTAETLEQLTSLALQVKHNSLCGLGRAAPNPVLSALRYFYDEFTAHLDGTCPAKKCKNLITYTISDLCIGCTKCAQRCPADAIEIRPYAQHEIDQTKCIKCDTCRQICPQNVITRE